MGAPKQKWTPEEEAALKAGIKKHGVGKWSTILKDPEFNPILCARSNVDLKDKFRNLNCSIMGSRQKRNNQLIVKKEECSSVRDVVVEKDSELINQTSLATPCEMFQGEGSKKPISRVDDVILEAITKLKEPRGSRRASIAQFIADNYSAPPDLEKILAANLKEMTKSGRLYKVKNQYRIAPKKVSFSLGKEPMLLQEAGPTTENPPEAEEEEEFVLLTKAMVDAELERMRRMSPQEAAEAAMIAVAEAEAAIAAAEAAAKEAEEAEAEAELARSFADAAEKALNLHGFHVR